MSIFFSFSSVSLINLDLSFGSIVLNDSPLGRTLLLLLLLLLFGSPLSGGFSSFGGVLALQMVVAARAPNIDKMMRRQDDYRL